MTLRWTRICILANYSEQFSLTDDERERVADHVLDHVAGRVPIIVTTTHFSTRIAAERSRRAQQLGAAMVMLMPPFLGATLSADAGAVADYFGTVADAIDIPIMIQDAPMSGTPALRGACWPSWPATSRTCSTSRWRCPVRRPSCAR